MITITIDGLQITIDGDVARSGIPHLRGGRTRCHDLTGMRFGRLVAVAIAPRPHSIRSRDARWVCVCDCGGSTVAFANGLISGRSWHCGCRRGNKT